MLFEYKHSKKRLIAQGVGILFNLAGFLVFEFYFRVMPGFSIIFLISAVTNTVLLVINMRKLEHFTFYENEIKVHSLNEDKILSSLNLLHVLQFPLHKKATKQITHVVTDIGEFTFREGEDDNYYLANDYLLERSEPSRIAPYYFRLGELRKRIPGLIISLVFFVTYIFYFLPNAFDKGYFLKILLVIQAVSILFFIGQWFFFKNKIKQA